MKKLSLFANFGIGQEKDYFVEQLSMLLSAGVPVNTALVAIKKNIKSGRLKKIIEHVSLNIDSGSSVSAALDSAGMFPKFTISLIRIGEQSGRLAENLKVIINQQQKERELRSKITSAMMYPFFVFLLTLVVGLGITWFILPRLVTVFAQLKIDLPIITQWLLGLGTFLGRHGTVVVPALLIVGVLTLFFLFVFSKTNFLGQAILFSIGPISRLLTEVELSRFGSLLGNLLGAGLPILDSLDSLIHSSVFYRYKKLYAHLRDQVADGNSFKKSFDTYKNVDRFIPIPIQQLIIIGEQSGTLPETFKKMGEWYENKMETTTKNISTLLEPVLLVVVWLGVVAVALAVILPLYSLIGGLNQAPPVQEPPQILAPVPAAPVPEPEEPKQSIRVLETGIGYLNVRKEPSLASPIIGEAKTGEIFEFLQRQEQWYQIRLTEGIGWVFGDYVEVLKP